VQLAEETQFVVIEGVTVVAKLLVVLVVVTTVAPMVVHFAQPV